MSMSDQELIEKVKAGDKAAFTELFDRYKDRILDYLCRYVGNYQTAEDLTVETFWNAYNSMSRYEEMGTFSSWLYRIATNCAKMELRKKVRRKETSLETPVDGSEDAPSLGETIADESARPDFEARQDELQELSYKIVARLEKKYKDVLLLCDVEGMSYEEAAKILKSTAMTVGARLSRGRKMLYDALKKYGYQIGK